MAKHRTVNTHFWDDSYIETLSPNEILLFLFLITNPQTNIAGSYEITVTRMHERTRLSRIKIEEILTKFEADGKFIYKDNWMLAVNAISHQKTDVPTILKGIETIILDSPQWVKNRVCIDYQGLWIDPSLLILSNSILSNSIPSDAGKGERPKPKKPPSLPTSVESEILVWLDAIAPLTGAKDRRTMVNSKRWRESVESAIKEGHDLLDFMAAVKSEAHRNKGTPQYFTPEQTLKTPRFAYLRY